MDRQLLDFDLGLRIRKFSVGFPGPGILNADMEEAEKVADLLGELVHLRQGRNSLYLQ